MNKALFLKYYRTYPAGFVLLGILTSLIPLNINLSFGWVILFAVSISAVLTLIGAFRISLNYVFWVVLGIIVFYVNQALIQTEEEGLFLKRGLYTDIKFEAIDNSLTTKDIPWLKTPNNVFISLSEVKKEEGGAWERAAGKFYFQNKGGYKFFYGKSYESSGTILLAERVLNKSFSNYLKSIGVIYVFYPETIRELREKSSWKATLITPVIEFRDKIMERCVAGINDVQVKDFLAGILFGCRQGLGFETRNKFLETGTIHIIAISGTHIGILALLFLFLLKPLPIRLRYFTVPIVLLIYIVAIGYLHSAVRAFIMVSIFFILKAALRVSNPFNVLFFACAVMLILNPYSLLNPGFQFSYIIVLFLMLGWKVSSEARNCCAEKGFWTPKKKKGYSISIRSKISKKFFLGIAATMIAGLASIPMQLFFNGLITPIMPVANILVLPLMFPLFLVSIIKVLCLGILPAVLSVDVLNFILEGAVNCIFGIVNFSYDIGLSFYQKVPNAIVIIFFYLVLISALMVFNKKVIAFLLLLILSAITLFVAISPQFHENRVLFLKVPESNSFSAILIDYSQSSAVVVNCPQKSYFEIENILRKEGINEVSDVYLVSGSKVNSGDSIKLLENYSKSVKSVTIGNSVKNTKLIRDIKLFCEKNAISVGSFPDQKSGSGGYDISFSQGGKQISLRIDREGNSTVFVDQRKIKTVGFENSNQLQTIGID